MFAHHSHKFAAVHNFPINDLRALVKSRGNMRAIVSLLYLEVGTLFSYYRIAIKKVDEFHSLGPSPRIRIIKNEFHFALLGDLGCVTIPRTFSVLRVRTKKQKTNMQRTRDLATSSVESSPFTKTIEKSTSRAFTLNSQETTPPFVTSISISCT